jgi:hypothetical protein
MEHIAAHQASQPGQHNTQNMPTHHPATNTQLYQNQIARKRTSKDCKKSCTLFKLSVVVKAKKFKKVGEQ